jgi:RNA polymerase sigma-70 factor (ECF subfamily)
MPSGTSGSLSTSLIQRLKVHDQDAWRRLLDLYVPLVFSWCRRSGLQLQDAEDVVQEVFQAVSRAIGDFQHVRPTDTFRGWLRTITRNKIHDHFRSRAGQPLAAGGTDAHQRFMDIAADDSQIAGELNPFAGVVHRALGLIRAEIEDRTWQAFWLAAVGQQSTAAVAQQLGMTPGAVRQAKYKVLRRLRQELGDVE